MATNTKIESSTNKDNQGEAHSERKPMAEKMLKLLQLHFGSVDPASMKGYTFERHHSDYPGTKGDLEIFDTTGKLVFEGREFSSGMISYWRPSRTSVAPAWSKS